jgi:hypothetical protein
MVKDCHYAPASGQKQAGLLGDNGAGSPNVRFAPIADIREIDVLQCEGRRSDPAICLCLNADRQRPICPES